MLHLPFEYFRNVATRKVVTVDPDGYLRQYPLDSSNLNQHWLRLLHQSTPAQGFRIISRTSNQVIDARGGQLIDRTMLQRYSNNGRSEPAVATRRCRWRPGVLHPRGRYQRGMGYSQW